MTATRHPDVRVVNHGRENWRTEVRDSGGEWDITGPPYPTKLVAMLAVDDAFIRTHFEVIP